MRAEVNESLAKSTQPEAVIKRAFKHVTHTLSPSKATRAIFNYCLPKGNPNPTTMFVSKLASPEIRAQAKV